MKRIVQFKSTGVFDHLAMDLTLNDRLTFLYGLNGSGKTTALKLMMALLEPSLEPLVRIPFRSLHLLCVTHKYGEISIDCSKDEDGALHLQCSVAPGASFDAKLGAADLEHVDLQTREFRENPVLAALSEIATPIFLGIDRRFKTPRVPSQRRRPMSARQMAFEFQQERSLEDPSFDPGLGEVAYVIEDFISILRRRQAGIDDQFRKQILLDAFAYVDPQTHGFTFEPSEEMFQVFRGKRAAIMSTLQSLGLASEEFEKRSDEFFATIDKVISTIRRLTASAKRQKETSKELSEAFTAWFVNQSQVDRIDRLFDMATKYQSEHANAVRPVNEFVGLTNRFFGQTGKEVTIDRGGEVRIKMGNRLTSLTALSSGERQIFIMLAHLAMNRSLPKDGVFIVDEPELSLHMAWQEMFVEAIEAANPKLQIILATHAPAIIGGRNELCIPVSKTEGNNNAQA